MRSRLRQFAAAGAVWAAAAAAPTPAAAQEGWWNYQWPHRRAVTVEAVPQTSLPGDEVCAVTMPTGGLLAADGRDVRVVTATGTPVPHRVLMLGPGDRVRLAFALRPPVKKYFVYFGNPKADPQKPAEELVIRRGVLLETWAYQGGGFSGLPQALLAFKRAGPLLGRDFRDNVFLGHNPFGPQDRLCSLFTGHLVCPEAGEHTFSTSSQDASFLLIDGKVVVENGGSHVPQRRAFRTGKVQLARGLHELKVYHVNGLGDPVVVAAWQEPSAKRLWTIPEKAFAPVAHGAPGIIERYGAGQHADFIPAHLGETFMADQYFQRYAFEARLKGALVNPTYEWDLGDGQKSARERCEHVYLRNGPFKVTLTVTAGGARLARTNTVYVTRPWDRVTINELDPLSKHAGIVAAYDFSAADAADLGPAIALLKRANRPDAVIRAGDALVRRDRAPAAALRLAMPIYADTLVSNAEDPARAIAALLKAAGMTTDPSVACEVTVRAGRIALASGSADRAMTIFNQAVSKYSALTTHASLRDARIGIGDVWGLRGKYKEALEAYQSARPWTGTGYEKEAVRKGDLARHAEEYLHRQMYSDARESLDKWEDEFPTDKLEGFSALLRVKLAMAQRQHALAARLAEQLVLVNPQSNYAPELLMLAAEAYEKDGKADSARQTLRRIPRDYPESPLAAEAAKKLGGK